MMSADSTSIRRKVARGQHARFLLKALDEMEGERNGYARTLAVYEGQS